MHVCIQIHVCIYICIYIHIYTLWESQKKSSAKWDRQPRLYQGVHTWSILKSQLGGNWKLLVRYVWKWTMPQFIACPKRNHGRKPWIWASHGLFRSKPSTYQAKMGCWQIGVISTPKWFSSIERSSNPMASTMKHLRNHQFITDDRWLNPKKCWLNLPCLMKSSFLLLKSPWWNEIPHFSWWNLGTLW